MVRPGRHGATGQGKAGSGGAKPGWRVQARRGSARHGVAGQAMRGWQREERHGWSRLGWAGVARRVRVRHVGARLGEACSGRRGTASPVAVWLVAARQARTPHRAGFGQSRQARHGTAWLVVAWLVVAWRASPVKSGRVLVWLGKAGGTWLGEARCGRSWLGRHGELGLGELWIGMVRPAWQAGQGESSGACWRRGWQGWHVRASRGRDRRGLAGVARLA